MGSSRAAMIVLTSTGLHMRIEPIAPHTFHIRINRTGCFEAPSPLVRLGVVAPSSAPVCWEMKMREEDMDLSTESASLRVDRRSGELSLYGAAGTLLTRQNRPPRSGYETQADPGDAPAGASDDGFDMQFALAAEERIYGLGDQLDTPLMKRGCKIAISFRNGKEVHAPVPLLLSSERWGLLMDTDRRHEFDVGCSSPDVVRIRGNRGELAFYLFAGGGLAELLRKYTELTGPAALLPVWAYGLSFNCNQQATARDMLEDAMKFRREGIPCDMIGLEPAWMDRSFDYDGPINWNPDRFYIPQWLPKGAHTFMGALRAAGFKLTLGLYLRDDSDAGKQLHLPENWYEYLKPFVAQGVLGFNLCTPIPIREMANAPVAADDRSEDAESLPHSTAVSRSIREGFAAQTGLRPMIYTPVGYTGIQKYAAVWSGGRSRSHLSVLGLGLSGIPHMAVDMELHTAAGIHCGFFQPWSKVNSWAYWRHPLLLDQELLLLFKTYARLRYQLLPYIYSAAHVAARTGLPIARAMPLVFPDDPRAVVQQNQYMFGDAFLVAAFTDQVYLPTGDWYDYWTGEKFTGPADISYRVPKHAGGPLFVRAGAIVPMWPDMEYAGQRPAERLELHVYPGGSGEFTLYEDDGVTFGYAHGELAVTSIACREERRVIGVELGPCVGRYPDMPESRIWEVVVHALDKPAAIKVDGKQWRETSGSFKKPSPASWSYDRKAGTLRLLVPDSAERPDSIRLEMSLSRGREVQRTSEQQRPPARSNAGQRTADELEKEIEVALETGNTAKMLSALERWWSVRMAEAGSAEGVREHWLAMNSLFVRGAERKGRTLHEIAGGDPHLRSRLQPTGSAEDAYNSLAQLAARIIEYGKEQGDTYGIIRQATDIIMSEIDRELSLHAIAERLHLNSSYLSRKFKQELGLSFSDYVLEKKMRRAKELLLAGSTVAAAADQTGFKDASYFNRVFRKYWGVTPGEMKS
ncbi:helix-turn-helix domain-containing protein [Paenibacillus ginsengarvi]|uniref:Helix-turn-helix domain-containing protein n=1 Tax=Paenibacillus ginsengarvi TaxID=400777 RepID=A0A3B0CSH5_9BACL|nr:helix-turn-helix domain-containing protein [Paenibacillus ginsengarvi]RKN86269.1 helix-turn-helix domain-containing protein [Paenibacillus ginsengarvi]